MRDDDWLYNNHPRTKKEISLNNNTVFGISTSVVEGSVLPTLPNACTASMIMEYENGALVDWQAWQGIAMHSKKINLSQFHSAHQNSHMLLPWLTAWVPKQPKSTVVNNKYSLEKAKEKWNYATPLQLKLGTRRGLSKGVHCHDDLNTGQHCLLLASETSRLNKTEEFYVGQQ